MPDEELAPPTSGGPNAGLPEECCATIVLIDPPGGGQDLGLGDTCRAPGGTWTLVAGVCTRRALAGRGEHGTVRTVMTPGDWLPTSCNVVELPPAEGVGAPVELVATPAGAAWQGLGGAVYELCNGWPKVWNVAGGGDAEATPAEGANPMRSLNGMPPREAPLRLTRAPEARRP